MRRTHESVKEEALQDSVVREEYERLEEEFEALKKRLRTQKDMVNDERTVICFAFRYSLGRQSTAPSFMQDYIKNHIDCFFPSDLSQMADEIDEQKRWHTLGDPKIDEPMWLEFRDFLKREAHKRVLQGGNS